MNPDVVVIGAGVVGACCARACVEAGLTVVVVDRGAVAGGTTGGGEGNILVSDKEPGPELDLALLSRELWAQMAGSLGDSFELDPKGGLVVATHQHTLDYLLRFADEQRACGVIAEPVAATDLPDHEPRISRDLAGGVLYPQDMQVQPMLAAAHIIEAACATGRTTLMTDCAVTGIDVDASGAVSGVRTAQGVISTRHVINAAGTWGGEIAALAGVELPILPRRGFILVTEPLPPLVRHKVYAADYVANVASDNAGLETSAVIEGTHSGTILIGASRERVGFDKTLDWHVLGRLAKQAIEIFPLLAEVQLLRTYGGFRPYCPDHLPVIGPDPRVPGLLHACGHEGAGVGLGAATGHVIAQWITGASTSIDLAPFSPARFGASHVA
ncbi:MAG: FAD-binding oxidoreductase [Actinobacteria bacterium]|nr:FAD-binding oxidoreductase [Actinomycetota bacterium]